MKNTKTLLAFLLVALLQTGCKGSLYEALNTPETEDELNSGAAIACSISGVLVQSETTVTAYQAATVPAGQACVSEQRTCKNGVLSGSFVHPSCTVATVSTPASCSVNGVTLQSGQSITAFQSATVPSGQSCVSEQRTCTNGVVSGSFMNASCTVAAAASCMINGVTVQSGQSVTAFQSAQVAAGQSCVSQVRTCANGVASGSFTNASCTVAPPAGTVRTSPTPGQWVNVTSNLAGMPSECGNMTSVHSKPSEDLMIAGIAQKGLWGSRNGGASWSKLGTASGSAEITNRPGQLLFDPANANVFYEAGIYNGLGIYRTDNAGSSFMGLGTIGHIDSVSVDFSDVQRKTLLAGGHEQKQTIYRSQDGGNSWINVGANLPGGTAFSSYPHVVNSQVFFAGLNPSWGGGSGGIYISTNAGQSWSLASAKGGAAIPLVAKDGSIYWPNGDGALMRGTGAGANWTWTQQVGGGTLGLYQPVELKDGRIASFGNGRIQISADQGKTWTAVGPNLSFTPGGLSYSASDHAIYVWNWDCGNTVLANAIMKYWL